MNASMNSSLSISVLGMCMVMAASAANTWYVDADNGNDEWNGKVAIAAADPDNKVGPKKTLAVFTNLLARGDSIYAAPGHYKEGKANRNFRFYTTVAQISLIATGNAENTFIEGEPDMTVNQTTSPFGCGANAVVPVSMTGGNCLIRGFTIMNGRQINYTSAYGGGAVMKSTDRMVDCVVTNCIANRGGGVNGLGHALRCRFTGNSAAEGAHALSLSGSAVNCVFENTDGYAVYNASAGGTFVNCTCTGNKVGNFRAGSGYQFDVYNSVFTKTVGWVPKNKNCMFYDCLFDYDPTVSTADSEAIKGTNGECRVVATGTKLFNADGTPFRSGPLAGAAVQAYYDDNFPVVHDVSEKPYDIRRNNRTVGGAMDLGAVERPLGGYDDNEWFVDAVNGDNSKSGKTPELAKKSLVAIMDERVKGDTVYAAPGVYSNDTIKVGSQDYRVKIPAGVQLVGIEGAGSTVILGKASETPDSKYGTGPGAIACVYCAENDKAASWVSVSGFTLSGGRTYSSSSGAYVGAAVHGYDPNAGIMTDCVVTNCVAGRGPVYAFGYVIRCRFYDNMSVDGAGGSILDVHGVFDSYFTRSRTGYKGTGNIMHDIYQMTAPSDSFAVNCTFEGDGACGPHAAGINRTHVYNSIVKSTSDAGGAWYHNCVNTAQLGSAPSGNGSDKDDATIITNAAAVALSVETYTPVAGINPAVGKGDYTFYTNLAPACIREHIGKDLWGNPRLVDGRLDVGAVACDSPALKVTDASTGLVVTGLDVVKDGLWHDAKAGGDYKLARDFTSEKFLRGVYVNGELIDFNAHADDWKYSGTFTSGALELTAYYPVVNDWYVDANNGNDENDGLTPSAAHAFKTLARASTNGVLLAYGVNESKSTVYVAEGLYNTGVVPANFISGLSSIDNQTDSRLYVHLASFVATGRREATIIEGASSDATECGIGPDAVRCCLMRGGNIRGFTLRNGNVNANSEKADGDQGGGIRSTSSESYAYDCEIHHCNAVRGGGAQNVQLVRCYLHDNTVNAKGVEPARNTAATTALSCSGFNSVLAGDCYSGGCGGTFLNCTCLGNCWGGGVTYCNCYVGGDGSNSESLSSAFSNCVSKTTFKSWTKHDGCVENTPCTFDENWRPKRRLSPLVDTGDLDLYNAKFPSAFSACKNLDYAGGPRVLQETIDIGAGERPYTEPQGVLLLVR